MGWSTSLTAYSPSQDLGLNLFQSSISCAHHVSTNSEEPLLGVLVLNFLIVQLFGVVVLYQVAAALVWCWQC